MSDSYIGRVLGQNERIVVVARQHPLVLLAEILSEAVLAATVALLITIVWRRWDPHPLLPLAYLVLIFPMASLAVDVLRWRQHQFVVTSRRVVEASGILNKEVTDSSLEKINDIKMTQSFFGRLFGFGDLEILTASDSGLSRFRSVRDPIGLKTAMLNAKEGLKGSGAEREGSAEGEILSLIAHLDSLQQRGVVNPSEADQIKAQLLSRLEARA